MGTVTVTTAGFASLPAQAPTNWPSWVTYPGPSAINGSHTYNISDADMLRVITWAAASQFQPTAAGGPPGGPLPPVPATPTAAQILFAWVQYWWKITMQQEQQYSTTVPVVPPPITVT